MNAIRFRQEKEGFADIARPLQANYVNHFRIVSDGIIAHLVRGTRR
jgi:hypothetical protein